MAKKKKEKQEEIVEEKKVRLSEIIDLHPLYRVKGDSRIHYILSQPNASGMVGMRPWAGGPSKPVHVSSLTSIAQNVVWEANVVKKGRISVKHDPVKAIPLSEVFDNLFDKFGDDIDNLKKYKGDIRNVMCPNFDDDKFQNYHADRIIKWYSEIMEMVRGAAVEA